MKKILLLQLLLCPILSFSQSKGKVSYYDKVLQGIYDSLSANNVDTILIYEKKCHGCIENWEPSCYIFWQQRGYTYGSLFDGYGQRNRIAEASNVFDYFLEHSNLIQKEKLDSTVYISDFKYSKISFFTDGKPYGCEIPDYYFLSNKNSYIVNFLYRVEYIICHG